MAKVVYINKGKANPKSKSSMEKLYIGVTLKSEFDSSNSIDLDARILVYNIISSLGIEASDYEIVDQIGPEYISLSINPAAFELAKPHLSKKFRLSKIETCELF